jgi:hypothetical protein
MGIKIYAKDIIAGIVIVGSFVLIALGKNSYLYPIVTLICGYYFAKREQIKK